MENKRKPWIKLTPQEIQNLTNRQYTDCKFYPKSNGTSGKMQPCDYIFMVGHSRGCDHGGQRRKVRYHARTGAYM